MPEISVNGTLVDYPNVGDVDWGNDATNFAILTSAALGKLGLASGTSVDIGQTLDVTGNTTLDANLSVGGDASVTGNTTLDANLSVGGDASVTGNTTLTGNLTVNGNATLGNGTSDTTAITGILNVDSGVLYVDPTNNRVGINDTTPSVELDVNGAVAITGNETVGGTLNVTGATTLSSTLGVTGDVAVNTNKFNVTASSGNTTIAGTLGVTGNTTVDGVIYADDSTTANTPVISFTGDTDTGIGRSADNTLDFVTGGQPRFRIEPTGQIKAVYESTIGTDYNTQLDNGYLCRAWVNFNGTSSNLTGTYTRSGNTITVSITSHGLSTGQTVYLDFTTGGATDGVYVVTVVNANSYTVTDTVSGTITTSNVTQFRYIRASGNVSSITDNGTGDYTVNFASPMPDSNYSVNINARGSSATYVTSEIGLFKQGANTANNPSVGSFRFITTVRGGGGVYDGLSDADYICVGVFR